MKRTNSKSLGPALAALEDQFGDLAPIKSRIKKHEIETPSWAYGNSGTRFKVFPQEGVPRNPFEKMEDAAAVHDEIEEAVEVVRADAVRGRCRRRGRTTVGI